MHFFCINVAYKLVYLNFGFVLDRSITFWQIKLPAHAKKACK